MQTDPALEVVTYATTALLDWFGADAAIPAKVGTTDSVAFFAGDGAPLAAWDSHASKKGGCATPFIWTRMLRRYRTRQFPTEALATTDCALPRVLPLELGVGWCAYVPEQDRVDPAAYAAEAVVSSDVAWRLEEAMCMASGLIKAAAEQRLVGTGTLVPYGPEGGVIAWTGVLYATY